jgi:hypothetical protein
VRGPRHRDPAGAVSRPCRDRQQAGPAEPAARVMLRAVVQGQARLGHRAGDIAGERRQRVTVGKAVPVGADQPGCRPHELRGLGCRAQRAELGLLKIILRHAVPPGWRGGAGQVTACVNHTWLLIAAGHGYAVAVRARSRTPAVDPMYMSSVMR